MAKIRGTNGNDFLTGTNGSDEIDGEGGDDLIFGRNGNDIIRGGSGDDFIFTGGGDNTVDGGTGDDIIIGGRGDDTIEGGDGDDLILAGRGDDTVDGGAGNDTIIGDRGDDTLNGGAGNDTIIGGRGADTMDGGDGSDTYQVGGRRDGVDSFNDTGTGAGDYDVIQATSGGTRIQMRDFDSSNGIEEISANGNANVDIRGDNSDNTFDFSATTLSGIREIDTRGGDDSITGSAGDDNIDGGSGFDTVFYSGSIDDYDIQRSGSTTTVTGDGTDTLNRVEVLQFSDYTLFIDGRNNAPVVGDDAVAADEDTGATISVADLIANDKDYDGDTLTIDSVDTSGTMGSVSINSDGTLSYDPGNAYESLAVGETATDSFTYTVSDGEGGFATGTVTVTVNGANDGPTAADDTGAVAEDGVLDVPANGVLSNDSDPDASDTLTVGAVEGDAGNVGNTITLASGALLTMNEDGSYSYDPNGAFDYLGAGETATDTFTYTVTDGHGGAGTPAQPQINTLIDESFDAGAGAFSYSDDTFRGTGEPDYADGAWGAGLGDGSGGLQVTLGGQDNADILGMSGGWTTTIDVPEDASGTLTFKYNLSLAENYEADEFAQVMLSIDGSPVGVGGADFIAQLTGDGNGGPVMSTGWQTVTVDLGTLTAGSHTITFGGYSNKKTFADESADIRFDDIQLTTDSTPMIQDTLLDEGFDGGAGGFAYVDDAFRGTGEPDYADGAWGAGFGETGGGLQINLGGQDGADILGMSGGWQTTISVPEDASGTLTFKYNMTLAPNFESDEFGQVMVSIDGTLYGVGGNDFVAQLNGDGNGGAPTSTGWQTFTVNLADLPAGDHTLVIGGYSNKKTFADESIEILIDDVQFTTSRPDPDATGPETATVSVTITGVDDNEAPVASDDNLDVEEGVMVEVNGVLDNDVDPDSSDPLTVSAVNGAAIDTTNGSQITLPSGAILFMNPDGTYSYDPNGAFNSLAEGETGTDSFSYTATDSAGATDTATVTVTITGVNDAPVAAPDAGSVSEDDVYVVASNGVLANDVDPDASDVLTVTTAAGSSVDPVSPAAVTLPSGAILTMHADGTYYYDPNGQFDHLAVGESATDSFTYTADDGHGGTDTATVTVTINGANDAPVAADDTGTVGEDDVLAVTSNGVLTNDTDPDASDVLSVAAVNGTPVDATSGLVQVTLASGAIVSMSAAGTYSYDTNGAFEGLAVGESTTDSFTYTVSDGNGGTDTATVTITINGANDAPDAVNDDYATTEGSGLSVIAANGVLANDVDVDNGATLTVSEVGGTAVTPGIPALVLLPSGAFLAMNSDGSYSYNPFGAFNDLSAGQTATDSFTYTVTDEHGATDTATVTITVTGTNDAPSAADDTGSVGEDGVLTVAANGVLSNDSDPDANDVLSVSAVEGAAVDPGTGVAQVTLASGAIVTMNADGSYSYDTNNAFDSLAVGQSTTDSFTYTVDDGNGGTDTATVTITINGANDAPVAADDAASVSEDGVLNVAANGVLSNDSDPDNGDSFTVSAVQGSAANLGVPVTLASGALLTMNEDGSYDYDTNGQFESLAVGETATDSFTYTILDSNGATDTATVTITINGANDAPVAGDDAATVGEDDILTVSSNGVLTNDADPDASDVLSVSAVEGAPVDGGTGLVMVTLASGAEVTMNADGTYSYNTNGAFDSLAVGESTTDSFTYTVSDGNGGTDTATVTLTIQGANDAPDAVNDTASVDEDGVLLVPSINGVLANDVDIDNGSSISVTEVAGQAISAGSPALVMLPSGAVLGMNADGSYSYNPFGAFDGLNDGETATDSFTYTVTDEHGATDTATVTITIIGSSGNQAPVAGADSLAAVEDVGLTFNASDLLGNDSDVEGDPLSIAAIEGQAPVVGTPIALPGSAATVTLNADGSYTYAQNGAFDSLAVGATATDTFTYTVSDGQGGTDTATVTVTITGTNDGPVASADAVGVGEDDVAATTGNLLSNDSDVDVGDVLSVTSVQTEAGTVTAIDPASGAVGITLAMGGVLTIAADGSYSYSPNGEFGSLAAGQTATETVTYTVSDGNGGTDTAVVTFTVTGANDGPVATADVVGVGEDDVAATTGNLLSNDSDVDVGDALSVTSVQTEAGTVTAIDPASGAVGITLAMGGVLTIAADGSYSYDPNGEFEGLAAGATATETVTYTVSDGNGGTDTAVVTFTVTGANDGPVASADVVGVGEDDAAATTGNLLSNDSDVDVGDALSVTSVQTEAGTVTAIDPASGAVGITLAMGGVLTIAADGTYSYDPNGEFGSLAPGQTVTETVTYTVSDGNGGTDTAVVTFTVTGTNSAPIASADGLAAVEDVGLTFNAVDLLGNDSDVDGGTLSVAAIEGQAPVVGTPIALPGSAATVTLNADGSYTYAQNGAFDSLAVGATATDTFTYTVSDGQGGTDTATVTVTITGTNDGPVASADAVGVGEDDVAATTGNLLSNDSDVDVGDALSVTSVQTEAGTVTAIDPASGAVGITLAMGGVLTIAADGSYSYSPNGEFGSLAAGQTASETVTYTVSDGNGGTDTAVVTFTVTGANDGPVASADVVGVGEDDVAATTGNLLSNDSDVDVGDALSVTSVQTEAGTVTAIDPASGAVGITLAMGGVLTIAADGSYSYDPNGEFEGLAAGATATETVTYTVSDGNGGTDTAVVTFTVTGANDGPVAMADVVGVGEDDATATTGNLLGNDSDVDVGDVLSVTSVQTEAGTVTAIDPASGAVGITLAMGGVLTIAADGSYSYSPNGEFHSLAAGQTATETVTYTVSDGNGGTDTAVVTFTVTGANDGPVATADVVGVGEDDVAAATGNLLSNDSDVDTGDTLSVTSVQTEAGTVTAIDPASGAVGITLAMGGVLTIAADGSYSYDPNGEFEGLAAGATATETVTYTVSDGNGGTDTAVVTFTVTGANDGPVATADVVGVGEDDATATTGNLLSNDSDVDVGDVLSVTSVQTEAGTVTAIDPASGAVGITLAMGGVLTIAADGSYSYSPNGEFDSLAAGQTATETVTYTVSDGNGGTDTAVVTFTVTGANDGPVATADVVGVGEDDVTATTGNLLSNDSDVDTGDSLSVTSVQTEAGTVTAIDPASGAVGITLAMGGVLTIAADGSYSYSPNGEFDSLAPGQTATETVTYTVSDGNGGTDTAVVTFTVTGTNDAPVASADGLAAVEDVGLTFNAADLLGNDSDVDGGTLSVAAIEGQAPVVGTPIALPGSAATVTLNADGSYTYAQNGAFDSLAVGATATDTFTYTVSDGQGGTDTATVTVTITGTNDGPVASADAVGVGEDDVAATTGNLLSNDSDVDVGDALSVTSVQTEAGTVTAIDPASGAVGITLAMGGVLTIAADGSYSYSPNGEFEGLAAGATATETVTYTVSDGNGGTDTAVVTFTVTGTNDGPVASADGLAAVEDVGLTFNAVDLLGNDSDVDGGTLSVAAIEGQAPVVGTPIALPGSAATVTLNADGSYTYAQNGAFDSLAVGATATDTFTYTVSDGQGGTDTATVTVTITGTNDGPVASADAVGVGEDDVAATTGNLLANDSDVDVGDALSVTSVQTEAGTVTAIDPAGGAVGITLAMGGVLTIAADGSYSYSPNGEFGSLAAGQTASETVTYTVSDGNGGTDTAVVTFTVVGTNDGPVAVADVGTTDENTVLSVPANGVLSNDSDPDAGDTFTVTAVQGVMSSVGSQITLASGALLTMNSDGSYSYDPNGQFQSLMTGETATDTFNYTITDSQGATDTATVTVTIDGVSNAPPVAADDAGSTTEDDVLVVAANGVLSNDTDPDTGDVLTITEVNGSAANVGNQITLASGALLTMNSDGSYSYDPNGQFESLGVGQTAIDTFTYTVDDGNGATDTATVSVTVNGVNDAPIAVADSFVVAFDNDTEVESPTFLSNDYDPEGSTLTLLEINGTPVDFSAGQMDVFLANGDIVQFNPDNSFIYVVNDPAAGDLLFGETLTTGPVTYMIQDAEGLTATGSITFTVANSTFSIQDLDGTNGFAVNGVAFTDLAGQSVSNAGDVNGDGYDDFIVGAFQANPATGTDAGAAYVVFGSAAGPGGPSMNLSGLNGTNGFTINGAVAGQFAGRSVSSAGDVNGDGIDDLLVGIRDESNGGVAGSETAYVVYGSTSGFGASLDLGSLNGSNGFAVTGIDANFSDIVVGSAGDVNGDGIDDFVIGSQGAGTSSVGASYVVFGQSGGMGASLDVSTLDGTNGFMITGTDATDNFGFAVSGGDLNNDGYDDVIVGATGGDSSGGNNSGEIYVVYGAATGIPANIDVATLNGTNGVMIGGALVDAEAGNSVSSAGDVNGDGIDDLVIGARGENYSTGGAYVVFGQTGGLGTGVDLSTLDGTNGFRIVGTEENGEAGYSVSMAGDINGDGFEDIIIGARGTTGYDPYGGQYANFGSSYVVFGSGAGFGSTVNLNQLDGNNGFLINGVEGEDTFGTSVSSAGDINGDGYDDLIIGSPRTDATGNDSGAAYVLYGTDFQGNVTHQGTSAADTLTGDATANSLIGGQGDDFLSGAGGADVFYAGHGNDTMVITDLTAQRIDGGAGEDTLQISGASLAIDLGDLPISSIETVDITGTGDNVLTLSVLDVLDASDETNTLKVLGDLGDQVVAEGGWTSAGQQLDGGVQFDVYTSGEATLMVESDINNVVIV